MVQNVLKCTLVCTFCFVIKYLGLRVQTIDDVEMITDSVVGINIEQNSITLPVEIFKITGSSKLCIIVY